MPHFDVRIEPWIPVVDPGGGTYAVGLVEALVRAHEWRAVRDPVPIVEFGILRLLTTLVYAIFHPGDMDTIAELLEQDQFDPDRIRAYFDDPIRRDAFDLFDPERPFLQTAGMDEQESKPLAGMLPVVPSGTNANHFHHIHEDDFAVCPAAAARMLASIPVFMTAGGAGLSPSINGAPPWYVWIEGRSWEAENPSLFHALLLNQPVTVQHEGNRNPPAWDRKELVIKERKSKTSILEALTWQPRRVQLIPGAGGRCDLTGFESDVLIRQMKFAAGWSVEGDLNWIDPQIGYNFDSTGKRLPLRPREGQAVWRDTAHLFLQLRDTFDQASKKTTKRTYTRPMVIETYSGLVKGEHRPQRLFTTLFGMRTDLKMKVFEWQREPLSIPASLLRVNPDIGNWVEQGANVTADIAFRLRQAVRLANLSKTEEGSSKPVAKERNQIQDHAEHSFWDSMQEHFNGFLERLDSALTRGEAPRESLREYAQEAYHTASKTFERTVQGFDGTGDALAAVVVARSRLKGSINKLLRDQGLEWKQAQEETV